MSSGAVEHCSMLTCPVFSKRSFLEEGRYGEIATIDPPAAPLMLAEDFEKPALEQVLQGPGMSRT